MCEGCDGSLEWRLTEGKVRFIVSSVNLTLYGRCDLCFCVQSRGSRDRYKYQESSDFFAWIG